MFFFNKKKIDITVYTVPGCHLCDEAIAILNSFKNKYRLDIKIINILSDPELIDKYQHDVPVVFSGDAELFLHRVDFVGLEKLLKNCR